MQTEIGREVIFNLKFRWQINTYYSYKIIKGTFSQNLSSEQLFYKKSRSEKIHFGGSPHIIN